MFEFEPAEKGIYLEGIELENFLCFEDLKIDFLYDEEKKTVRPLPQAVLFLGDNSAGKTTLLRALSFALLNMSTAAYHADKSPGVLRKDKKKGSVSLTLFPERRKLSTNFKTEQNYISTKRNYTSSERCFFEKVPENALFLAYSANRSHQGIVKENGLGYNIDKALQVFFESEQSIHDPELSLRRASNDHSKSIKSFEKRLSKILQLKEGEFITTTTKGIQLLKNGVSQRLVTQGDGFQSMVAMVADIIAKLVAFHDSIDIDKLPCVIIIDEIEKHLHPSWQRKIIGLLCETFPKCQFIFTSHSPLCAAGVADLGDYGQVITLIHKGGKTSYKRVETEGYRADQILTSHAFGLETTINEDIARRMDRHAELFLKEDRTDQEEREYKRLSTILKNKFPGYSESAAIRAKEAELRQLIADLRKAQ